MDDKLVAAMGSSDESVERDARELIVLELHREGVVSMGKSAELLEMPLLDYIRFSGQRGIPVFDMTLEEWDEERARVDAWIAKK